MQPCQLLPVASESPRHRFPHLKDAWQLGRCQRVRGSRTSLHAGWLRRAYRWRPVSPRRPLAARSLRPLRATVPPSPPPGRPARAHTPHSRECSNSRAALAARSRPVGSKLLHLSLGAGRSPAPRSPPPSAPGCTGGRGSGGPAPSPLGPLMPKSHDMARERHASPPPPEPGAVWTRAAQSTVHAPRAGGRDCAGAAAALPPGRRMRVRSTSPARPSDWLREP